MTERAHPPRLARVIDPTDAQAALAWTREALARRDPAALYRARLLGILCPHQPPVQRTLGRALMFAGQAGAAAVWLQRFLARRPADPEATLDLSTCLADLGRPAEALAVLDTALAAHPGHGRLRRNRAVIALSVGRLDEGWADQEARLAAPPPADIAALPRWHPGRPAGDRVLVWREQGLGDEILYGTCLPDLLAQPVDAVLACDPRLVSLMARSLPDLTVRPWTNADRARDRTSQIPIASLPGHFRAVTTAFPDRPGYLSAAPAAVSRWTDWLAAQGPGPWIGIAWTTRKAGDRRDLYSPPRDLWARLLAVPGVRFVVLQYGANTADLAAFAAAGAPPPLVPPLDLTDDQDGLAALISALDLVISPGIAVADLAGGLGRPCWVPMPWHTPHWQSLGTGGWPWYPSWRLFRKPAGRSWGEVVDDMVAALHIWRRDHQS